MNVSENGLNIIRKYEGCRLTAYKAVSTEKYYTIGYGHYGADVKKGSCTGATLIQLLLFFPPLYQSRQNRPSGLIVQNDFFSNFFYRPVLAQCFQISGPTVIRKRHAGKLLKP